MRGKLRSHPQYSPKFTDLYTALNEYESAFVTTHALDDAFDDGLAFTTDEE